MWTLVYTKARRTIIFEVIFIIGYHAGNLKMVDFLINRGANIKLMDENDQTPKELANETGKLHIFCITIQKKCENLFIWTGKKEIAELLNKIEDERMTLHEAADQG